MLGGGVLICFLLFMGWHFWLPNSRNSIHAVQVSANWLRKQLPEHADVGHFSAYRKPQADSQKVPLLLFGDLNVKVYGVGNPGVIKNWSARKNLVFPANTRWP